LCDALQLLNHLQDCRDDYRALDRVYLPLDTFAAAGIGVEALDQPASSPALGQVLDRVLDGVDAMLITADELPRALRSRRLAAESAVIVAIARRLAWELRWRDPLAERVELSRLRFLLCGLTGIGQAIRPRPRRSATRAPAS
jgi:phytoene/squalene synthetase